MLLSAAILLAPHFAWADQPGFYADLNSPSSEISPYPREKQVYIISITYRDIPQYKRKFASKPKVERSDFETHSLTFSSIWYKSRKYIYSYIPRSADATAYLEYRRRYNINEKLRDFSSRALSKEQKNKRGGLFQLDIPVKSKAMEALVGEGGLGLKVSGTHKITFSGRSQWDNRQSTATYRQSKFPSLNMEQISRFDISGTIGTKITVSVRQDSKTDIPLANRLMIRYKGDEDDIIKTIEAGNTTLSLPNTQFVGYSTRIQGLFGLKTEAQIGGLKLTAIASQEKGSTERTTIEAGGGSSKVYKRDWDYLDGKIYDLGRKSDFQPGDKIIDFQLYKYERSYAGVGEGVPANMYVDPEFPDSFPDEATLGTIVNLVNQNDYWVDENEFWILFFSPIPLRTDADLGAYMKILRGGDTIQVGETNVAPGEELTLKLIKHKNPLVGYQTWNYLWRNVYSLGSGGYGSSEDLDLQSLDINIFKGPKGTEGDFENFDYQDGTRYIRILGLDQINKQNNPLPDDLVDVDNEAIIDTQNRLLIFPHRRPFDTDSLFGSTNPVLLNPRIPEIYINTRAHRDVQEASQYYIEITSKSKRAQISLRKTNIIEGSERITANGVLLKRDTDYRIDYNFGKVTLQSDRAIDPNANISIDFEYSPFILAQKKSLFGTRAQYEFNNNFKLGATFLYKSDKATERKPKIGQETSRMVVWDIDGSFRVNANFLTSLVNALPFYSTDQESKMAISAEIAQSLPNPNVAGIAYIDDFEGSRDAYSLGIIRGGWYMASKPAVLDDMNSRGKLIWYNPYNQIATNEIWDRQVNTETGSSHTLWLKFSPDFLDLRVKVDTPVTQIVPQFAWSGIMRPFIGGSKDHDQAAWFEIRLKGRKGILHFDFGQISEDTDGDGELSTEDSDNNKLLDVDSLFEDLGLDFMTDVEEQAYYGSNLPDPSGDNWLYVEGSNDYSHINGTQDNRNDPVAFGRYDTEDLDRGGGSLNKFNNYYSYVIDLSDTLTDTSFYVDSSNFNGWKTFRIPVKDSSAYTIVGNPDWKNIEMARIWVESPDQSEIMIGIASVGLISNIWEDTLMPLDTSLGIVYDIANPPNFEVAVINTQENSSNYKSPPGVTGYDNPTSGLIEPEQSLLLHFENFAVYDTNAADTGIAERILINTANLLGYRTLKMYVHGPPKEEADSLMFFFRIGTNNKNYYEYNRILDTGWADNEVIMDFDVITGLREYLVRAKKENPDTNSIDTTIGSYNYRIVGAPNITKIKYMANGVVNMNPQDTVSGDVWINELRLIDVRRDKGLAARISISGNVADLFTYNGGYTHQNSFFRKISGSTRGGGRNNLGSGQTSVSYNYGINFKMDRFLPRSLKANIPVAIGFSKNIKRPRLRFNSDIILPDELRDEESSYNTTKRFTISESFSKKTKNPLFTILLNQLKSSFSYNRNEGRSPASPMSLGENISSNVSYGFTIKKVPSIRPFFWTKPIPLLNKLSESKFFLLPNQFTSRGDFSRNLRITRNVNDILTTSFKRDFRGVMKINYKILNNLTSNYSMDTKRDLSDPKTVKFSFSPKKFKLGRELGYSQQFGSSFNPNLFSFLTHKFTFSTVYRESYVITNNTRTVSSSKSYGIDGNFDFKKLFGTGKSRRRQTQRRGKTDESKVIKVEKGKSPLTKMIDPPRKLMGFLTGWINPITYNFKEYFSYSFVGLRERAQAKFRFGLTDDIGAAVDSSARTTGRSNAITKSTSYSFRSGTQLFGGLKADVTFSRSIKQDVRKAISPTKTVSTNFPDINFSIKQFKTFKFLNPLIKKFKPRTKYTRSKSETINKTSGIKQNEKTTTGQNPLLSFDFALLKGMNIRFSNSRSVSESRQFNPTTGELNTLSRNISKSTTISTKYSFSWPAGFKFPLFGRLRIKSTMSVSVDVTMRTQRNEKKSGNEPLTSQGTSKVFMVQPSMSYTFSSQIKGGVSARWQDTDDGPANRKVHVRELRIWVDIRF